MISYILNRLILAIPVLFGITVITFTMISLAPGDAATGMINPEAMAELSKEDLDRMRRKLGLDKPIPVRYVIWLGQVVRGNFGYETAGGLVTNGRPVLERIKQRLRPTLELTVTAVIIATVLGVSFGVLAALYQYSFYDYALSLVSLSGISIPTFFFALAAMFLFALKLEWVPIYGIVTPGAEGFPILDNLHHLALPALILSIDMMSGLTRYARTAMLEVLSADYVRTARAKGLSEFSVIGRHAFRNALLPLITITTSRVPFLVGGTIIVETMFSWPGMGLLSIEAVRARDFQMLMGLTFFISALVLLGNLLADILYASADPRIRY